LLGDFQAFDSFREDDSRKYNRLFEMAQKMPERFGLSIVFSANSAWATPDGDVPMGRWPNNDSDRLYDENNPPEDALFEFPSIRVEEVSSADFVDSPAANQRGLFSKIDKPNISKMTKAELTEKNDELVAEAEALEAKLAEVQTQLAEQSEEEAKIEGVSEENEKLKEENESLKAELEELKSKLAEGEEEMGKLNEEIESSQEKAEADAGELMAKEARIAELSKLIEGSDPVQFSEGEGDYTPSKANRNKVIAEYAAEHGISEFTATLRLGKEKPELFTL
jgi:DNA repair exonuclease SbcCD ATPase subunit